jgi:hypothetical protein
MQIPRGGACAACGSGFESLRVGNFWAVVLDGAKACVHLGFLVAIAVAAELSPMLIMQPSEVFDREFWFSLIGESPVSKDGCLRKHHSWQNPLLNFHHDRDRAVPGKILMAYSNFKVRSKEFPEPTRAQF